jgi:hypothetical protein
VFRDRFDFVRFKPRCSSGLNSDSIGVGGERSEVSDIPSEDHAARFCAGNDEGVYGGTSSGQVPEFNGATGKLDW